MLAGPPGVGKTLAARVVTAALRLDLFEARVRGFAAEQEALVPLILRQASAHHFSVVLADAELLGGPALDEVLAAAATLRGMVLFETRRPDEVDAVLRAHARLIELPPPGRDERRALWERAVAAADPAAELDLDELAEIPGLTGRDVLAAVQQAAVNARGLGRPLSYPLLAAQLARRS